MEVKNWSYEAFPEYTDEVPGAKVLETTGDEIFVSYEPDVQYAVMDGHPLTLQLLIPSTRNDPDRIWPVYLFVQGSAWGRQNVYRSLPDVARVAERGYVAAIVEYRGSDVAPFPATIVDTQNAVRFIKTHAGDYHADPDRILLAGCSSGGHAAVYSQMFEAGEKDSCYPGVSAAVQGVIDYYGSVSVMAPDSNPTTINHCLPDSPEGMEMGHVNLLEHPELQRRLSIECNITRDTVLPPILIIHGTKDRTVNTRCSTILYETLKQYGHDVRYILLRGADHGGAEFWMDSVLDEVDAFAGRVFRHT